MGNNIRPVVHGSIIERWQTGNNRRSMRHILIACEREGLHASPGSAAICKDATEVPYVIWIFTRINCGKRMARDKTSRAHSLSQWHLLSQTP